MKEGWEYKPFETCLEKVNKTKKIPSSNYLKEGFYPIVSQEESLINGFHNNHDDIFKINRPVVIFGDHTRILKYIDFDFVIGADGVKILSPIPSLFPKFFYYSLKSLRLPSLGYSRHYKLLKEQRIPVPPLAEQKRIVDELDLLSSIVEKQKQQLKELDALAQSIFYDMFGDPVTNEKGWEVKKLEAVCKIICGQDHKPVKDESGKYPIYGSGGFMGFASQYRCPENTVIIGRKGNINNPIFVDQKFWNIDTAFGMVSDKKFLNPLFFFYFCRNYDFTKHDVSVTIPSLRRTDVLKITVLVPPLHLQNLFASKIEAIEKQKEAINKSIEETQKLFDYTMDKYFRYP